MDILSYSQSYNSNNRRFMEEEVDREFRPDRKIFTCFLCQDIFEKPVTLPCGHSYCHYCILGRGLDDQKCREGGKQQSNLVPMCTQCRQIIWRPLSQLKENVAIAGLMAKYRLKRSKSHPQIRQVPTDHHQHHILIEYQETNVIPMPHCTSQIVFTTAFMDEIIEQQSQTNPVILRCPQIGQIAIAGRISRPEIYHVSAKLRPNETTFRAQFDGLFYVNILRREELMVKVHSSFESGQKNQSPIMLCQWSETRARNTQSIGTFSPFFNVYDQLNNPIYLRQIANLVNEGVLNERRDCSALIYCIMRVLRIKDRELADLVQSMDDEVRWRGIEEYLMKNIGKPATEVIKIKIPGNYPHELLFIILFTFSLIYYFTQ